MGADAGGRGGRASAGRARSAARRGWAVLAPSRCLGGLKEGFRVPKRNDTHSGSRFPDDGKHPALTAATSAGKVFLHTPHDKEAAAKAEGVPLKFLSINRKITALTAGALRPQSVADVLLVGTPTALLAYDVEANSDLFYKEVPDGVNAVIFGHVPGALGRTPAAGRRHHPCSPRQRSSGRWPWWAGTAPSRALTTTLTSCFGR